MYTLTTQVNGMGTVTRSPTGTSFPAGTNVTLTATPASGNDFAGWTGDASGATNPITVRILGNTTVTGNFVPLGNGRHWIDPARVLAQRDRIHGQQSHGQCQLPQQSDRQRATGLARGGPSRHVRRAIYCPGAGLQRRATGS